MASLHATVAEVQAALDAATTDVDGLRTEIFSYLRTRFSSLRETYYPEWQAQVNAAAHLVAASSAPATAAPVPTVLQPVHENAVHHGRTAKESGKEAGSKRRSHDVVTTTTVASEQSLPAAPAASKCKRARMETAVENASCALPDVNDEDREPECAAPPPAAAKLATRGKTAQAEAVAQSTTAVPVPAMDAAAAAAGTKRAARGAKRGSTEDAAPLAAASEPPACTAEVAAKLEELVDVLHTKCKIADVLAVWSFDIVPHVRTLSPSEQNVHPLHVAVHRFHADAVALFVAAGMNVAQLASVSCYAGDNLNDDAEVQGVSAIDLHAHLVQANATEGGRSARNKALKAMGPYLVEGEAGRLAAVEALRALTVGTARKPAAAPGVAALLPRLEAGGAATSITDAPSVTLSDADKERAVVEATPAPLELPALSVAVAPAALAPIHVPQSVTVSIASAAPTPTAAAKKGDKMGTPLLATVSLALPPASTLTSPTAAKPRPEEPTSPRTANGASAMPVAHTNAPQPTVQPAQHVDVRVGVDATAPASPTSSAAIGIEEEQEASTLGDALATASVTEAATGLQESKMEVESCKSLETATAQQATITTSQPSPSAPTARVALKEDEEEETSDLDDLTSLPDIDMSDMALPASLGATSTTVATPAPASHPASATTSGSAIMLAPVVETSNAEMRSTAPPMTKTVSLTTLAPVSTPAVSVTNGMSSGARTGVATPADTPVAVAAASTASAQSASSTAAMLPPSSASSTSSTDAKVGVPPTPSERDVEAERQKAELVAQAKARMAGFVSKFGQQSSAAAAVAAAAAVPSADAAQGSASKSASSASATPAHVPSSVSTTPASTVSSVASTSSSSSGSNVSSVAAAITSATVALAPAKPVTSIVPPVASAAVPAHQKALEAAAREKARQEAIQKEREETKARLRAEMEAKKAAAAAQAQGKHRTSSTDVLRSKTSIASTTSVGGTASAGVGGLSSSSSAAARPTSATVSTSSSAAAPKPFTSGGSAGSASDTQAARTGPQRVPASVTTQAAAGSEAPTNPPTVKPGAGAASLSAALAAGPGTASLIMAAAGMPLTAKPATTSAAPAAAAAAPSSVAAAPPAAAASTPAAMAQRYAALLPGGGSSAAPGSGLTLASLMATNQAYETAAAATSVAAHALNTLSLPEQVPVVPASAATVPAPVAAPAVARPLPAAAAPPAVGTPQGHATSAARVPHPTAAAVAPSPGTLLFSRPPGVLRPADTDNYEMSDHEGSEDDYDDEEEEADQRASKRVPDWAHGPALAAAVQAQFGDGGVDPDSIFPDVQTCDLEAIFRYNKRRFVKRTSSGNWHQDRLTAGEKLKYRMDMGFDR